MAVEDSDILSDLDAVIRSRWDADPDASYVAGLLADGPGTIARKMGEEAIEAVVAGLDEDREALINEVADLWFHSMVLLAARGASSHAVRAELARRFGLSGLEEKAGREDQSSSR